MHPSLSPKGPYLENVCFSVSAVTWITEFSLVSHIVGENSVWLLESSSRWLLCPLVCPLSLKSTSKLLSVVVSYYIVVSSQLLQEQRVRNVTFWDVNETGEAVLFLCMCVGGHWVGSALPLPEAQRSASLLMKALLMTLSLSQNVSGSCLVVPVKSEAYWNQRYVWGHIQYICMYLCVYHLYNWINRVKWASLA